MVGFDDRLKKKNTSRNGKEVIQDRLRKRFELQREAAQEAHEIEMRRRPRKEYTREELLKLKGLPDAKGSPSLKKSCCQMFGKLFFCLLLFEYFLVCLSFAGIQDPHYFIYHHVKEMPRYAVETWEEAEKEADRLMAWPAETREKIRATWKEIEFSFAENMWEPWEVRQIRKRATEGDGDAEAQAMMGTLYREGVQLRQSEANALEWFQRAADQGSPEGQYQVGREYWFPNKTCNCHLNRFYKPAFSWYRKAAEQGHAEALLNLGIMQYKGLGTMKNANEALLKLHLAEMGGALQAKKWSRLILTNEAAVESSGKTGGGGGTGGKGGSSDGQRVESSSVEEKEEDERRVHIPRVPLGTRVELTGFQRPKDRSSPRQTHLNGRRGRIVSIPSEGEEGVEGGNEKGWLVEFDEATSLWRYDNSRHQNNFPKSTKLRKRVWVPPEHIRVVAWNEVEIASP